MSVEKSSKAAEIRSPLPPERLERYRREGFLGNIRVLSPDAAADFRRRFERLESHELGSSGAASDWRQFRPSEKSRFYREWALELATHPNVLGAVASVLGEELFIHSADLYIKEPGRSGVVPWHTEIKDESEAADCLVKAWIWLTPSRPENGCLKFVAGSHLRPAPHVWNGDKCCIPPEAAAAVGVDRAVDDIEEPGQLLLQSMKVVHGSETSRAATRRMGFAVLYFSPDLVGRTDHPIEGMPVRAAGSFPGIRLRPNFPVTWHRV